MTSRFNLSAFVFHDRSRDLRTLADAAKRAGRSSDLCQIMKAMAEASGGSLDAPLRDELVGAYRAAADQRAATVRTVNEAASANDPLLSTYRGQLVAELEDLCQDGGTLLDNVLIPAARGKNAEAEVVYRALAGELHAHLAQVLPESNHGQRALAHYEAGVHVAQEKLPSTHPARLTLMLRYARGHEQISQDREKAMQVAKMALDEAIAQLHRLDAAASEQIMPVMTALKSHLDEWLPAHSA